MSEAIGKAVVAVGKALAARRWRGSNERQIQDALAEVLSGIAFRVVREHCLSDADRVDFAAVIDGPPPTIIALEVKVRGSLTEVARQIQRYTQHPEVGAVIFAATSHRLVAAMPRSLGEVPIFSIALRRM
jgi:hypothetical protein